MLKLFERDSNQCGSLTGLRSSEIGHIQQAASRIEIRVGQITTSAEIVNYGVSDKGFDVVYVQFDSMEVFNVLNPKFMREHKCDSVHFILKHSYFRNLHRYLDRISDSSKMIECLIPETHDLDALQQELQRTPMPVSDCLLLDKEYQLLALKKLMVCDSSVPFLVTGPFGTGKTRLLAAAAVKFLENPQNRVLICTSHLQSADAYVDNYFGPMLAKRSIKSSVKRFTTKDYTKYYGYYRDMFTKVLVMVILEIVV